MSASPSYRPSQESDHGGSLSSVGELLGEISGDLSTLMRQEMELAKAELMQAASKAGKGGGMLGAATIAGHMLLLFLSVALWWALGDNIGLGWSALVVAAIWGVIGVVLAAMGRAQLRTITGLPRTTETAKKIPDALKGKEDIR